VPCRLPNDRVGEGLPGHLSFARYPYGLRDRFLLRVNCSEGLLRLVTRQPLRSSCARSHLPLYTRHVSLSISISLSRLYIYIFISRVLWRSYESGVYRGRWERSAETSGNFSQWLADGGGEETERMITVHIGIHI